MAVAAIGPKLDPNLTVAISKNVKPRSRISRYEASHLINRPGRNRTCNPRFWRPVLYQLSYGPRNCCRWKLQKPERPWKAQCFPLFAVGEALCHRRGQVGLVDDVVAVEHRARSPAAQLRDLALRHAGAAEVPRGRAAEVMHQHAVESGALRRASPRGTHRADPELLTF